MWVHGYSNDFRCYIPSERLLQGGRLRRRRGDRLLRAARAASSRVWRRRSSPRFTSKCRRQFRRRSARRANRGANPTPPSSRARRDPDATTSFVVELVAAEPLVADPGGHRLRPRRPAVGRRDDRLLAGVDDKFERPGSVQVLADRDGDGRFDEADDVCKRPPIPDRRDGLAQGRARLRRAGHPLRRGHRRRRQGRRPQEAAHRLRDAQRPGPREQPAVGPRRLGVRLLRPVRRRHPQLSAAGRSKLGGRDFRFKPTPARSSPSPAGRSRAEPRRLGQLVRLRQRHAREALSAVRPLPGRNPHVVPPAAEVFVPTGDGSESTVPDRQAGAVRAVGPAGTADVGLRPGVYRDDLLGTGLPRQPLRLRAGQPAGAPLVLTPRGARSRASGRPSERTRVPGLDRQLVPPGADPHRARRLPVGRRHVPLRDRAPAIHSGRNAGHARSDGRQRGRSHLPRPAAGPIAAADRTARPARHGRPGRRARFAQRPAARSGAANAGSSRRSVGGPELGNTGCRIVVAPRRGCMRCARLPG